LRCRGTSATLVRGLRAARHELGDGALAGYFAAIALFGLLLGAFGGCSLFGLFFGRGGACLSFFVLLGAVAFGAPYDTRL
jgi:hypothetical protein